MKKYLSINYIQATLSRISIVRLLLIAIACGIIISLAGLTYWGYRSYANYQEQLAQKAFSQVLDAFNATEKSAKEQEWESVLSVLNASYDRYKRSSFGPFFLVYKAEVLLRQQKKEQALETLDQMLNSLSDATMRNLFGVKRALLLLDFDNKEQQEMGIKELQALASEKSNIVRDMAQYYLGDYYIAHNNIEQAKEVWQELIESQWQNQQAVSPWARLAQETLKTIS